MLHRSASATVRSLTSILSLAAAAACSETSPTEPLATSVFAPSNATVTTPATGPWSSIVNGKTGPGALYEIYVPREWNGEAVSVAHGFRDAASPVDLRNQDNLYAIRDALGAQGYAVAYSSFSENGFAVKDGAQRTHQLRGLMASVLEGQPSRHYLVGYSLGGGIAESMAERFSNQYDGALLVCGMVGGSLLQTQYLGHARALFDTFFPGVLQGDVLGVPAGFAVNPALAQAAIVQNLPGLLTIASTAQTPLPFMPAAPIPTLVQSMITAVSFHARGINNITDLTHGHSAFENSGTQYSVGTPLIVPPFIPSPAALQAKLDFANANVARYTMDPAARNYLANHFTPSGALQFPVLTLHNRWDPAVPAFHETALRSAVQASNATQYLTQRLVDTYGHCNIPAATALQAFADMAGWVATGVKPAG